MSVLSSSDKEESLNAQADLQKTMIASSESNTSQVISTALPATETYELSPMSKIPPEILAEIFIHARYQDRTAGWLAITLVCRHWRELALDTTALWNDVTFSATNLGSTHIDPRHLARAKQSPMRLEITAFAFTESLRLLLSEVHRAETLVIITFGSTMLSILQHLPPSAPLLTSLQVYINTESGVTRNTEFLNGCETPALRSLSIFHYTWDWTETFTLPRGLTSLTLFIDESGCDMNRLVHAVQGLPVLKSLTLAHLHHSVIPAFVAPTVKMILTHLQEMSISGFPPDVVRFLDHFNYPLSATTSLDLKDVENFDFNDLSLLLGPIRSRMEITANLMTELVLSGSLMEIYVDKAPVPSIYSSSPEPPHPPFFRLAMPPEGISVHLPLWNITSLGIPRDFQFEDTLDRPTWARLFQRIPNVEILAIGGQRMSSSFPYMRPATVLTLLGLRIVPAATTGEEESTYLFPRLKHLFLRDITLSPLGRNDFTFLQSLAEVLVSRAAAGYKLELLTVAECCVGSEDAMEKFRALARVDVVWDSTVEVVSQVDSDN
ncbi:hypothetical protein BXZ70DRAFT_1067139 [Cristinia sonorae]|uniref:F-box domain-containing protein n=1 Tax=Cristinia sonorae TaxID=1940300 RepID=A0A8K0UIM9_9AGAR|nr:hypothetical protein BXZ70DRAFT_1067139 [Cristinia sonorae]